MKIDLAIVSYDKDAPSKGPGNADADRGAMGDAFGKAVRDAEGRRPAPSNDRSDAGTKVGAPEAGDEALPVADAGSDAESEKADAAEPNPLETLLGALVASVAPKVASKASPQAEPRTEPGEEPEAAPALDPKLAVPAPAEEGTAKGKGGSMQLDVLRMETHFEPRQDGMVLVEGAAEAQQGADPKVVDPKRKAAASGADGLASTLADLAKPKAADVGAKPVADKATSSDDASLPPLRFDEALAQLGRGGGDRSGGDNRRGGSASPLAELAARQGTAKGTDAPVLSGAMSIADPLPNSSPYNLAAQVAGPIMDALGEPAQPASRPSSASSDAHLRMRAGGGALKTLTIQLHPEHLGTVDVSLRLNEGRLTLELAASRSDTASMLLDDQASLRKLLEHAGFSLDDAAISVITRDSGQIRTAESGASNAQPRDPSGGNGGDGRSQTRGQSGGSNEQQPRREAPSRPHEDQAGTPLRSGATYL